MNYIRYIIYEQDNKKYYPISFKRKGSFKWLKKNSSKKRYNTVKLFDELERVFILIEKKLSESQKQNFKKEMVRCKALNTKFVVPKIPAGFVNCISQTTDFSMFSLVDINRTIDVANVISIMESIKQRDLTEDLEAKIDKNGIILDSQHTICASIFLGLPITFVVTKKATPDDIALINSSRKNWAVDDYIDRWVIEDNKNYIKLRQVTTEFNIPTNIATTFFGWNNGGNWGHITPATKCKKNLERGLFIFPDSEYKDKLTKTLEFSSAVVAGRPSVSIIRFFSKYIYHHKNYNHDHMMNKIHQQKKTKSGFILPSLAEDMANYCNKIYCKNNNNPDSIKYVPAFNQEFKVK